MCRVSRYMIALSLMVAPQVSAGVIALSFTGGTRYLFVMDPLPNTIGWEFILSAPVTVTSLGFHDYEQDGLVANHNVAIWNASQSMLVSAVVTSADPLDQGFRWVSVGPVGLAAGTYRIGALVNNDDWYYSGASTILTAAPVLYSGGVYALGGWAYPDNIGYTVDGRFGPNFQFDQSGQQIPEPGTFVLLAAGLLATALLRRRPC